MAKSKKYGYVEPADYFPPEVRKMFETGETEPAQEKKNPYRDQSKKMIEEQRKKKAAKKS